MISLERLLNRLDVEVELVAGEPILNRLSPDRRREEATPVRYTRSGVAVLELDGGATVRLSTHRVTVQPPSQRTRAGVDGCGDRDLVVTASVRIRITYGRSVGLFDDLPEPLVADLAPGDPIRRSFEELLDEIASVRPGCRAMAETLLRHGLILLLRRHFEHGLLSAAWLAALEDARLGRAIAAMQDRPEHCFTLAELAEVAGMSRSVFAARFTSALSKSPIEFLKALRLGRAADLLARTDLPVKAVAAQVGYSSRSAFTRAFVARHGTGPTTFRMTTQPPTADAHAAPQVRDAA